MTRVELKTGMTKEEYISMYSRYSSDLLENLDILPCNCEYPDCCTGWKLIPKLKDGKNL